jgi:hypothetical protein
MDPRQKQDPLVVSAVVFLASNLLHGADHLRQGAEQLDAVAKAGGAMLTAAAVAVVVLAVRRHRVAVPAAALLGFTAAALVTSAHVLPQWSVLSSSYVDDLAVDTLSWVVALLEIAAALLMGAVAASRRSSRGEAVAVHG